VKFGFSEEQDELRRQIHRFLEEKSPESEVRRLMATDEGFDRSVWSTMAEQLGLQAMTIPERYGGAGFGYVESLIVFEETGAALLCSPYFATVALATNALLSSSDEVARARWLPAIAAGESIATLAISEDSGRWDLSELATVATKSGQDWTITGQKNFVLDGTIADLILVVAVTDDGPGLFAVEGAATGLTRTRLATLDQTRKQARLAFEAVPATLIGVIEETEDVIKRTLQLACVALVAEQVGGAQRVLDASVEYAKNRVQFGRPIGSFQAIKHKCADMLLEVESAKSAAYYAAWTAQEDDPELALIASLAKAYCSDAFSHCASENIQIHGGIGFTWEHPAHLYFKRAKSSELLLGDPFYHREIVATQLGI
jgi:alkylation response protein AidB-like acyl-CoA dehydrogenase